MTHCQLAEIRGKMDRKLNDYLSKQGYKYAGSTKPLMEMYIWPTRAGLVLITGVRRGRDIKENFKWQLKNGKWVEVKG